MKKAKGFSLFTPLVGTTVVAIAILLAAVMIQNDIRISRGLSSSYEVSSQAIAGKLIRAAAGMQILQNIEKNINKYLDGSHIFTCSSAGECENDAKKPFKDEGGDIESEMRGADGIYHGVVRNIEIVTNYEPSGTCTTFIECGDDFDCCISEALKGPPPISVIETDFIVGGPDEGKYIVLIDADSLDEISSALSVEFQSKTNPSDRVTLSIVPHDFSYTTPLRIGNYIKVTAEVFEDWVDNDKDPCDTSSPLLAATNVIGVRKREAGGKKRLEVDWEIKTTPELTYTLIYQDDKFTDADLTSPPDTC